ncbi:MAG: SH3 domain-containing protein, partial [Treponema sp.]|nr:SH3 domain-containing protein [Treponema sp.]
MRSVIPCRFFGLFLLAICAVFTSCARLGWGVLLWSTDEPPIPSGTVLPVYIRSNIDKVWVVGIPDVYRKNSGGLDKMEIPLSRFELVGSRKKARQRVA